MNVFELFAKLGIDTKDFNKGLSDAEKSSSDFGSKLKTGVGIAAGVATAAIAATTATVVGGTKAFLNSASSVAQYGDTIDKESQKLGISAKAYQEWDAITQHSGVSMSNLKTGMKTLAKEASNNSAEFKKLGISQKELSNLSKEDLFAKVISSLQKMPDGIERTTIASKLLGRSSIELGALLNTSAEDTEKMRQRVHELGGVMSDEAVKASAGFQDSLQDMKTAMTGVKNNMMADFLPSLSTVMDGLGSVFAGEGGGLAKVETGIKSLADNIVAKAPQIFNIGGSILSALVTSIGSNLPILLKAAVPVMGQLVTSIVNLAPSLIESVFTLINSVNDWLVNGEGLTTLVNGVVTLITTLANSLATNISTILPTVVTAIMQVLTMLTSPEVVVSLTETAITLVQELTNGIINALPIILEQLPTIIDNICKGLLESFPLLLDAGIQLFMSLIDAIPTIIEALITNLPTIINTIIDFVLKALPLLLSASVTLFMALIKALPTIISLLVKELPKIVSTIISTLLSRLPELIKAAVQLFMGIIKAIPQIIIELGKQMPTIIKSIVEGLVSGLGEISKAGIQLMKGLLEGLKKGLKAIGDGIKKIGSGVVGAFKKIFKIQSPSKVFAELGNFMAEGLGVGFEDGMEDVSKNMTSTAEGLIGDMSDVMSFDDLDMGISSSIANASKTAVNDLTDAPNVSMGSITINVYANDNQDVRELAKQVSQEIQNLITDKEKVYA